MRPIAWLAIVIPLIASGLMAADPDGELLAASRQGDLAAVKQLLDKGAALEAKTAYGQTPLYVAAMNGHEEVVRYLLDKGASLEITDTFYKAPILTFALMREHYGVAKLLLQKGTKVPDQTLVQLVQTGKTDLVQTLISSSKPSQSALDSGYATALQQQNPEMAAVLKKAGANEPAPPAKVDPKVLESYAGTYKSDSIPLEIKVFIKDGTLYIQATGQGEFSPTPKSATVFEFAPAQVVVEFDSAASFTLKQLGQSFVFKKVVNQ